MLGCGHECWTRADVRGSSKTTPMKNCAFFISVSSMQGNKIPTPFTGAFRSEARYRYIWNFWRLRTEAAWNLLHFFFDDWKSAEKAEIQRKKWWMMVDASRTTKIMMIFECLWWVPIHEGFPIVFPWFSAQLPRFFWDPAGLGQPHHKLGPGWPVDAAAKPVVRMKLRNMPGKLRNCWKNDANWAEFVEILVVAWNKIIFIHLRSVFEIDMCVFVVSHCWFCSSKKHCIEWQMWSTENNDGRTSLPMSGTNNYIQSGW